MAEPFTDDVMVDDLHELMAVAILAAQRGVEAEMRPVFETWGLCYPGDALGPIGTGLSLIRAGETKEGYALVEAAANSAETRRDQAKDVLTSLQTDLESVGA